MDLRKTNVLAAIVYTGEGTGHAAEDVRNYRGCLMFRKRCKGRWTLESVKDAAEEVGS